jgi:DNA-binding Xre family transcriptional regulator
MISYRPLWETMKRNNATTYTLREKGGISGSTVRRMQRGESVSTNTIDELCRLLGCGVGDVVEYVSDAE